MQSCATKTGQEIDELTLEALFEDMDINNDHVIDKNEFISFMF